MTQVTSRDELAPCAMLPSAVARERRGSVCVRENERSSGGEGGKEGGRWGSNLRSRPG